MGHPNRDREQCLAARIRSVLLRNELDAKYKQNKPFSGPTGKREKLLQHLLGALGG